MSEEDEQEDLFIERRFWTLGPLLAGIVCILVCGGMIGFKVVAQGYRITQQSNEEAWIVRTKIDVAGDKNKLVIRAMIPLEKTPRQTVANIDLLGKGFDISREDGFAVWRKEGFSGSARCVMSYTAQTRPYRVSIPIGLAWDEVELQELTLDQSDSSDGRIGVSHKLIQAKAEELRSSTHDVAGFLKALFDFTHEEITYAKVGGPTDALTCLQLGEGSCNGKNRLLVALAQSQGLAARMCKGLILKRGTRKTTSHAWSEVYLNGQWIPFCPTGGYFARLPEHYLEYPKVDQGMFSYTKNVKLSHVFEIARSRMTPEQAFEEDLNKPGHILSSWGSLGESDFSLSLLMIILTIPIGVTLVCFLRSVVGLLPFGTFLPALIAVSFRDTGLAWGVFMFLAVMAICITINQLLKKLHILHYPRISIIFCCVVLTILAMAVFFNHLGFTEAAKVGMFPLAILTLTIERFSLIEETDSLKTAFGRLTYTIVCAALCYLPMMSFTVKSLLLLFPEILLLCIGLNFLMGLFTDLRWTERYRFRLLLKPRRTGEC